MSSKIVKSIIGWNVAVILLLLLSVAANVNFAEAAKEPPIRVFHGTFEVNGGGVDQTTDDVLIDSGTFTTVAEVTATLPAAKPHMCLANASAEMTHLSGDGLYVVDLERNGINLAPSVRLFELINNAGLEDPKYKEVSTLGAWTDLTGETTIRFRVRKYAAAVPDMKVTNASLTLLCFKRILGE